MLLLLGLLDKAAAGPWAVGVMIAVLISAIVTESIYELASHVAAYEREKRSDALTVLKISDDTRLELDRGDLEIMKASADLVLAEMFQRADAIRKAIPGAVERSANQAEILNADKLRDELEIIGSNGNRPKVETPIN